MTATRSRTALAAVVVVAIAAAAGLILVRADPARAQASFEAVGVFRRQYDIYNSKGAINEAMSSPALGDVTGDGQVDIVVGSMDGVLQVLDINNPANVLRYIVVTGGMIQASPTLVDLTGDGVLDVLTATADTVRGSPVSPVRSHVVAYDMAHGGQVIFARSDNATQALNGFFGTPVAGDIDGDGQAEIVASGLDHQLYAWNLDGSNVAGFPVYTYDTMFSSPALADLDNDGLPEIVVGGDMDYGQPLPPGGYLWAVNGNGTTVPGYPTYLSTEVIWSSPAIGDINGDGRLDVVVGTGQNFGTSQQRYLYALDLQSATPLPGWPVVLDGATMASPALANVHGDSRLEVVTATSTGDVYALNSGGGLIWKTCGLQFTACGAPGVNVISSPVVADVDGDGVEEVLYNGERQVKILQGWSGQTLYAGQTNMISEPGAYAHAGASSPSVARVNGRAHVVANVVEERNGDHARGAGDWQGVYVWRSSGDVAAASWHTFHRNTARTGSMSDNLVVQPDPRNLAFVDAAYQVLLGRAADSGGQQYWGRLITFGLPRQDFAFQLARSREWVNGVVSDLYQRILGRAPDGGGLAFWSSNVSAGLRVSDFAAQLYASPEYFSVSGGGTIGGWVDALYNNILGRSPDPAGHAYWVAQISNGYGRHELAKALFLSYESNVQRVDALYSTILNRAPDAGGRDYWGNLLVWLDDIALAAMLVSSDEFYSNANS